MSGRHWPIVPSTETYAQQRGFEHLAATLRPPTTTVDERSSMVFTVNIDTDNAAFEPEPDYEVARILRSIAKRIEREGLSGFYETILDANGNDVGRFALKPNGV